jgi:lipopolysaccharide transport system permease protein
MNRIKHTLELSLALAKAGFKLRNEGTWLGILWYLLAPILTFLLMLGIFKDRLGADIPSYPLYLLLGIILFNFFQKTTDESIRIIRTNNKIIKSINFPKESLIGSVVMKTFFSHIFEIVILIVFLMCFRIPIKTMLFYPLILIFLSIFSFGASLILASFETYFFDLDNIWRFAARLIWLGTPIFYAIGEQNRLYFVNLFNPMFYFIAVARDLIIYVKTPQYWMMLGLAGYSILALLLGLLIFNRLKIKFAEII